MDSIKNAVLITIGDEILSGSTIDTNSNFIASELKNIGIRVVQIFTVSDEVEIIKNTLKSAFEKADLVITTGGLGPTKDDRTKKAFCDFFEDQLVLDEDTFRHLEQLLIQRKRAYLLEINRPQAEVPSQAKVFQNFYGTAPALMLEKKNKTAICLPGVPYEVKPLIREQIIPFLKEKFSGNYFVTRFISVVNYPEAQLSKDLEEWELALPKNVSLSYLPIANRVKLKLTASGNDDFELNKILDEEISKLRQLISNFIIAEKGEKIEEILHDILVRKNLTLSVAESCTGGELSHLITSVSGSSQYFSGGIVAYNYQKKIEILGVLEQTILEKTVVSEEVAQEMSLGCQQLFKTDISISTTGVAGPHSDEFGNEIGLVYYSLRVNKFEKTFKLRLPHLDRKDFANFVAMKALQDLVMILVTENL